MTVMMVMVVITDDADGGDGDVGSNLLNKAGGLQVETRTDPLSGANVVIVPALSEGYLLQHRPMDLAPVDRALELRRPLSFFSVPTRSLARIDERNAVDNFDFFSSEWLCFVQKNASFLVIHQCIP